MFFILFFNTAISFCFGQNEREIDLEALAESIFSIQEEGEDYEALYESLYTLYQNPIDLNHANREALQATYLLSPLQLNQFFKYRETNGKLLSIYELQTIPSFDLPTIYKLLPFVTVQESIHFSIAGSNFKKIKKTKSNFFIMRYERGLEQKLGFSAPTLKADSSWTSRYQGSADKLYLRFKTDLQKDISLGFSAEKDAGEQLVWDPTTKRYGLDFWSFHIGLKNKGKLKTLVIGDYALQFGQGLVFGAGFAPGKGAETITTIKRGNVGIRPYTSIIENGFFRGAAATIALNNLNITTFFSYNFRDAIEQVIIDSLSHEDVFISSLQLSGLHRTVNEIEAKSTIKEQVTGTNLTYSLNRDKVLLGLSTVYTDFSLPLYKTPRLYNQFEFYGRSNYNVGGFYSLNWRNINFFGEAALSKSGGMGVISGIMMNLSQHWEMSILYRRYDRDFHTFYGSAFGENTKNINEQGVYLGVKYRPSPKVSFTAYFDQFRFPWLKYRVNAPSEGTEILTRMELKPTKKVLFYGQYKRKAKAINVDGEIINIKQIAEGIKQDLSFNLVLSPHTNLSLRSRLQFSNYSLADNFSKGFAIAQDVSFNFWKVKVSTRMALFDTDDYNTRQYIYEKDVLHGLSIPAYYGKGIRNYIVLQYNIFRDLSMWFRISRTRYIDQNSIGSGLETIEGNTKTDIKLQMRYKF